MALPSAAPERQLKHRRSIEVNIFSRGNGLSEVDAEITAVKTRDVPLSGGLRRTGRPIRDVLMRIVVAKRQPDHPPFQNERCHPLSHDRPSVKMFCPSGTAIRPRPHPFPTLSK